MQITCIGNDVKIMRNYIIDQKGINCQNPFLDLQTKNKMTFAKLKYILNINIIDKKI